MILIKLSNEEELQKREAIGIIWASRFVRNFAKTNKPINIGVIKDIHKTIFKEVGQILQENIEKKT